MKILLINGKGVVQELPLRPSIDKIKLAKIYIFNSIIYILYHVLIKKTFYL